MLLTDAAAPIAHCSTRGPAASSAPGRRKQERLDGGPGLPLILPAMVQRSEVKPETWAVMAGRGTASAGVPLNVPPVLASNFQLGSERSYSRNDTTPTWEAFEELLGGLEGGEAVAFASGMGAAAAVFDLLPVGAKVVLVDDCYHAVSGLAAAGAERGRWRLERVRVEDTARWIELAADADLVWLESPSNPLLRVADLPAICAAPRSADALVVIDSTFATPLVQRPLDVATLLARLDRLALVEAVLAARERDLDLRMWAVEVDARRHDGQAALLDLADEAIDLALVGQQLARAFGVVVLAAGGAVGRDVDVVQPQLAVAHLGVAVLDLRRAAAQRLDLGAGEHEAALPLLQQVVAVGRLLVGSYVGHGLQLYGREIGAPARR